MEEENQPQELYERHQIEVDPKQQPMRIDKFLFDRLANVTRSKIQDGIRDGYVKVGEVIIKPNYKVKPGDVITVYLPEPPRDEDLVPEDIPINIVYEDEDLLIVNKEAGMVVHPAYQNWSGTLVNAIAHHFQNLPTLPGNDGRPGLVHRIDKYTSGLLVIAKTELAMSKLAKQFYDHSIERTYYALIWGIPDEDKGTINVNLGRSLADRRITVAFPEGQGRTAISHYEVLEKFHYVSLVKCNLETGRTHQIRAHFKYIGHPLFADALYGGDQILRGTVFTKYKQFVQNCFKVMRRQALHAKSLGFIHPRTNEYVEFDSELPQDFQQVLEKWRHYTRYHPDEQEED